MATREAARFETALKAANLSLDERDKAAALRVFVSLEQACKALKSAERPDE